MTGVGYPWSGTDTDKDMDTGRLESGLKFSTLAAADSGIDSTPEARFGRTGRGYNTVSIRKIETG